MSRYKDAVALRRALEARLKQEAATTNTDLARLRRRVVFERLMTRLAADPGDRWVLKGGVALEFRLLDQARATKDLDLLIRADHHDGAEVRDLLIEALSTDPDQDRFTFLVGAPAALAADNAGRPGWRFPVEAALAAKPFALIRLDVVARDQEVAGTERLRLPGTLAFADMPARAVEAVDRRQHFAEKLHALTRDYGDRPSTRVKDLADLILLIETNLPADANLVRTVRHVFTARGTHAVPIVLPDPPPAWRTSYPQIATGLTRTPPDLDSAMAFLRRVWTAALQHDDGKGSP